MKYIEYDQETNEVRFIHNMPFDEKEGLNKTEEELNQTGLVIESLPKELPTQERKIRVLFANPLRWEYVDRPLTQEEKLQDMVSQGILTQEQMNDLLK